jgi:hypothetical protein
VLKLVARVSALVGGDGRVTTGKVRVQSDYDLVEKERRVFHTASAEVAVECPLDLAARVMSQSAALQASAKVTRTHTASATSAG